ncbi:MAG: WD40 repeat domain-containing protein [Alphaproteobacteria bacterium]
MKRASVRDRVRAIDAGEAVVGTHVLGQTPIIVTALGEIIVVDESDARVTLHDGAILDTASDGTSLITGGDDGRVMRFSPKSGPSLIAEGRAWVDRVALSSNGGIAWSTGKIVHATDGKGEVRTLSLASSASGLAFFPKGFRLAISHYMGATLWFPNMTGAAPQKLEWKGSHTGVEVSPDARFVVTTMQESQLHGWRLEDGQHMRMSGYPAKVRSMSWTHGGKFLATSGSAEAILWPFSGKTGPMGQSPTMIAPSASAAMRVTTVAGHPQTEVVATGFTDGLILLARISDGAEILLREPDGDPISALAWSRDGKTFVFGTEGGKAGVASL